MMSERLSAHFMRSEFACRCGCGRDTVDYALFKVLLDLREEFGEIKITSGNRCPRYNRQVGGAPNSQHLKGKAADIQAKYANPARVQQYLIDIYPDSLGIGGYETFTHIDSRNEKARWGVLGE